jgi:O-antigen ligase
MRGALFLASFLLFWISVEAFVDLRSAASINGDTTGNFLNQIALVVLAVASGVFIAAARLHRQILAQATPALLLLLGWLAISVAASSNVELSFRRLVQTLCIFLIAAVILQLPKTIEHFNRLLLIGVALVLAVAYFGVLFMPELSIHSAEDLIQPEHAGNWRGHFAHKNRAGGAMVILIFIGCYIATAHDRRAGLAVGIAAFIFLIFASSSTAFGLLFIVYLLSLALIRTRSAAARVSIVTTVLGLTAFLTIGTMFFEPARSFISAVSSDPTYTNRTELWEYGISQLRHAPLLGFGYEAFWGLGGAGYSDEFKSVWAMSAPNGHNAYLDIALSIGLPGLALFLLWALIQPIRNFQASAQQNPALSTLFLRIWLFGIFYACLESSLMFGKDPIWFMFLVAVFGLRLLAEPNLSLASGRVHVAPHNSAPQPHPA